MHFADRFDRINNFYVNDGEKSQVVAPRNVPSIDQGDSGSSNILNENARPGLIALEGCCSSEASQLLNDRMSFRDYFSFCLELLLNIVVLLVVTTYI